MKPKVKRLAIIASIMIAFGAVLAIIGALNGGFRGVSLTPEGIKMGSSAFSTQNIELKIVEVENFKNIEADLSAYEVSFIPSTEYKVEYAYSQNIKEPNIRVSNGTLFISENNNKGFNFDLNIFGFGNNSKFNSRLVKIYYPSDLKLGKVYISQDAGSLEIKNTVIENLRAELDLGSIELENIEADNLEILSGAGDCRLSNVSAVKSNIEIDMGDLTVKDFYSKGLTVEMEKGDAELSGTYEGTTKISSDLGDVSFGTNKSIDEYSYDINVDIGDCEVNGKNTGSEKVKNASAKNKLVVEANMGEIELNFKR